MRPTRWLILTVLLLAGCMYDHPGLTGKKVPAASTAQLVNTHWNLTQLGDQLIATPQGSSEIHFVLQSQNQRVVGFSGCNRMMGMYALNGNELKFDQMGGTMMACTANMEVERKFLGMFSDVARWEIHGQTLTLLNADGKTVAVFEARAT
jgi:heat shock protein HslJ